MEKTTKMSNSELLALFYAEALTMGVAIGHNEEKSKHKGVSPCGLF